MIHSAIDSFWSSDYAPHGYCLLWRPDLISIHLISDVLIAIAYFSIPFALVKLVRKRPDVQFGPMFWLFALFIFACGMTHVMAIWNLWHGNYGIAGVVKAITALASVPTAIVLWKLLPKAMLIPSPGQLQEANEQLSAMVMERDLAAERLGHEMSERKKAEAALVQVQKVDAIGQLTGGIAHDFNNLLQAVGGNLDLISSNPDRKDKIARWAGSAKKAVERGARLAGQLLVFARVQQLERSRVDVGELVTNISDMIRNAIGKDHAVAIEASDEPLYVHGEPTQLEMAVLNLAINARDAMPEGGTITIRTALADGPNVPPGLDPGRYVRISVIDHGCGMDEETARRSIDPFFTTKGVGKDTGLGLSTAYGFARQMGGLVDVHSAPGKGTRVDIYLPADEGDDGRAGDGGGEPAGMNGTAPRPSPKSGLVTIVDDDDEVRQVIVEMVEALGFTVADFADPEEALAEAPWGESELAVIDYMMPAMTGGELARKIRARHPDKRIVFISGYSDKVSLQSLVDDHSRVLRKPFSQADVAAVVETF